MRLSIFSSMVVLPVLLAACANPPASPTPGAATQAAASPPVATATAQPIGLTRIAVLSRNRPAQKIITGTFSRADTMAPIYPFAIAIASVQNGAVDAYFDHDTPAGFPNISPNTMRVSGAQGADGSQTLNVYGNPLAISPDGSTVKWRVVGMDVVGTNLKVTMPPSR